MQRKFCVLVLLSGLELFSCDKNTPPDINSISNGKLKKGDKSGEFLHKIKDDLRRNNDDYAEAMAKIITEMPLPKDYLKFHYVKGNANNINDGKRRAYDASFSDEEVNTTEYRDIQTPTYNPAKRFSKIFLTTANPTETTKISKENLGKLKLFFQKKESMKNSANNQASVKNQGDIKMKAVASNERIKLPDPEQLDMAPARGGRIHMLRLKGRLCQRNVLIPEGPKYDSKGQVYLPAFTPGSKNWSFEKTKPPKLILPICCNCCHKSVLGCE